jgi:hypothetical protein
MKSLRYLLAAVAAALALFAVAAPAQADGRWHHGGSHWRGGVFLNFGVPYPYYWGPRYYYYDYGPPAYYYSPPVVVAPASPPVYVERGDDDAAAKPTWWYWCPSAKGYYPYVKECPGGWQRVAPQQ